MREDRRLGRVAGDEMELAAMNAAEHGPEPLEVHRLLQAVADGLLHQRVIGNLAIGGDVLETGRCVGEHRGHEIVGEHPLQLRRQPASATSARHREGDGRVPPPARLEHRRIEERLHQDVARGLRMQIPEHIRQRK